jgi:hypothetical protein
MIARQRSHSHADGTSGALNGSGHRSAAAEPSPTPPPTAPASSDRNGGPTEFPHDMLTGGLIHVGLTPHEAQMYHTLLRHGPSTARFAIQQSHLDRATGYRILSRLRARGLVSATGYRPQRFVALDATRLLDRVTTILRDELEMHRVVREIYASGLPPARDLVGPATARPTVPSPPEPARAPGLSLAARYKLLPGHEAITPYLVETIGHAKEELGALLRPALVPEPFRAEVAEAIVRALTRGTRVRMVLDYHPADLEFLTAILRGVPEPGATLEVRFFAPQLARLFVVDRRLAIRSLITMGAPPHAAALGIASEDLEFVRVQSARFQTTWREAVPLENALRSPQGSVLAPPSSSRELRHWVERPGRADPRGSPMDALGFQPWRVLRS